MNAPLAEFSNYEELRKALNAVRDHRKLSLDTMNTLIDCPERYFEKILGPRPAKRMGMQSLGWAFGVLGVKCIIIEDPEVWARVQRQRDFKTRDEAHFQSVMRGGSVQITLSRRHMSMIQARGRRSRWEKMTEKQKQAWGKRMAKSRWSKVKSKSKEQARRAKQRKAAHKARKS